MRRPLLIRLGVYYNGASISHRRNDLIYMRLGCIRVVLQDLTGGKTIIHAFRVY